MGYSSGLHLFLTGTLLIHSVAATCTKWTTTVKGHDTATQFNNANEIYLENLSCPSQNTTCSLPVETYNLHIPRTLNITVDASELDSIFTLAATGHGRAYGNSTAPAFIDRNASVSLYSVREDQLQLYEDVAPGKNKTLYWDPYYLYSDGILGGCSNASLEGVYVAARAAAPSNYSAEVSNSSEAGGVFIASVSNNTGGAVRLGSGGGLGIVLVSTIVMAVAFFG